MSDTPSFWRQLIGDKERDGCPPSAGRWIALVTGVTACLSILGLSIAGVNPGWPIAWVAIAATLAVSCQKWLASRKGAEILASLINRSGIGEAGGVSRSGGVAGAIARILPSRRDDERGEPDQ